MTTTQSNRRAPSCAEQKQPTAESLFDIPFAERIKIMDSTVCDAATEQTEAAYQVEILKREVIALAQRAERAEFAADYDRYHAGLKFIELREQVRLSGYNGSWEQWLKGNVTEVSRATVYRYMAFARKQDAETQPVTPSHAETSNTASEPPRSPNATRQARHREKVRAAREAAKVVADKYINENASVENASVENVSTTEIARLQAEIAKWKAECARLADNFHDRTKEWMQLGRDKQALEKKLADQEDLLRFYNQHLDAAMEGPFTKEEWSILTKCLHPDSSPSVEMKTKAMALLNVRKAFLIGKPERRKAA